MATREVRHLAMNEVAWTVPWTVILNGMGEWFVHATYAIRSEPSPQLCVKITRMTDGIEVDLSGAPYDWHPAPLWNNPPPTVALLSCTVIGRSG